MLHRFSFVALLLCTLTAAALADVKLPALFADHMVLQREMPVPVWGWAAPGEPVSVRFGEQDVKTTAGADGKWLVKLAPLTANDKPATLVIQGKNTITIQDVLVGEVWVGSGQSNMQFGLASSSDAAATLATPNPMVRLFTSVGPIARKPVEDAPHSGWAVPPNGVPSFAAVLYYMGRSLQGQLHVPIGLIEAAVGGTRIEPWTPYDGFENEPALKANLDWLNNADPNWEKAKAALIEPYEKWIAAAKQARDAHEFIPVPPACPPDPIVASSQNPTVLYNGQIAPLIPFAIRGAVWYQGESNMGDGMLYAARLEAMITSWRKNWGEGDFPFGIVQIAPCNYGNPLLILGIWEAEAKVADALPNCGLAVTNDVGNFADIHPTNKHPVGDRLALWAMATVYGKKDLVYSGPRFASSTVEGDKIRIKFKHVGAGLASRDGKPLNCFTIAGADKKMVPATAAIDGDTVVVHADGVAAPVAAQFGCDASVVPNLMNKEGLPAPEFRTDGP